MSLVIDDNEAGTRMAAAIRDDEYGGELATAGAEVEVGGLITVLGQICEESSTPRNKHALGSETMNSVCISVHV
jgi:hypothetical protein